MTININVWKCNLVGFQVELISWRANKKLNTFSYPSFEKLIEFLILLLLLYFRQKKLLYINSTWLSKQVNFFSKGGKVKVFFLEINSIYNM